MRRGDLAGRLAALDEVAATGSGIIAATDIARIDAVRATSGTRRGLSPEHTVVGLFGATGSGKSSLLNALVDAPEHAPIAAVNVCRPTTSQPLAVYWQPEAVGSLLDWLEVGDRVRVESPIDERAASLVLVDLPDFDSVASDHRETASRLLSRVDGIVWVLDPQKYADAVTHREFLKPHAGHAAVTIVVLNQIDLLPPGSAAAVRQHLRELLRTAGIESPILLTTSARTGAGVPELRQRIGDLVAARTAADERIAADLTALAAKLEDPGVAKGFVGREFEEMARQVAAASGVLAVADAVGASYRLRAARATGWPLISWLQAFRPDPLRRLGLGVHGPKQDGKRDGRRVGLSGRGELGDGSGGEPGATGGALTAPMLTRSSLPEPSAAQRARLATALRDGIERASSGLNEPWRSAAAAAAEVGGSRLPDELDKVLTGVQLPVHRGWWWSILAAIQWIALAVALAGAGWLLFAALVDWLRLPPVTIPTAAGWPIPTLLIVAGVLSGILLAACGRLFATLAASARRRAARIELIQATRTALELAIVAPVSRVFDAANGYRAALVRLSGR